MTTRNRYVKVSLFAPCSTRLQDSKVVGQGEDYLLLERPQPKVRDKSSRKPRSRKPVEVTDEAVNA